MTGGNEAFSRVKIDAMLRDVGWQIDDGHSVRYEYMLPDGTKADYVLCNRHGHALAVLEAKRTSKSPRDGERQGRAYAEHLGVPFVFLANGTPENFGAMVTQGFPMVHRPGNVQMLELREVAGNLWQRVLITDQAGASHILDYMMIETADGWQINAVQILPAVGTGV